MIIVKMMMMVIIIIIIIIIIITIIVNIIIMIMKLRRRRIRVVVVVVVVMMMMMMTLKGVNREYFRYPHCAANCLQHVYSTSHCAIVYKSCVNTLKAHHVCYVVRRNSSAAKLD